MKLSKMGETALVTSPVRGSLGLAFQNTSRVLPAVLRPLRPGADCRSAGTGAGSGRYSRLQPSLRPFGQPSPWRWGLFEIPPDREEDGHHGHPRFGRPARILV